MKTINGISLLVLLVTVQVGCSNKQSPPKNSATPASPAVLGSQNTNQSPGASNSSAPSPAPTPAPAAPPAPAQRTALQPGLLGEYQAREVESKGVVTMVSEIQTSIIFLADGSYSRISKKGNRTYHSDSGKFRIDPPDKLVLTIMLSGKTGGQSIQNPPLEKTHKFSLSSDGDELKLISDKGSAVFRRVTKAKS